MLQQNVLALNAKLTLVDPDKRAHLISYLPDNLQKALSDKDFPEKTIPVSMTIEKLTRRIDISHFKSYLDTLSQSEKELFTSAFPKYQQVHLSTDATNFRSFETTRFSHALLKILFKKSLSGFPPPVNLPMHPMIEILGDTGIALSKLVYYLGFFDVVKEVKKILSKKTLKELQKAFDPEEITFLNKIGKQEKLTLLSPMYLHKYNGDEEKLKAYILERGIYRFAMGINKAPAEYIFFITYFLPKDISDKINILLKKKKRLPISYSNWEADILLTWRFLCTYSQ